MSCLARYCERRWSPIFFFSSRRRHTRFDCDWSSGVCSSDLTIDVVGEKQGLRLGLFKLDVVGIDSEIGRASCRERVLISVVAESLKIRISNFASFAGWTRDARNFRDTIRIGLDHATG